MRVAILLVVLIGCGDDSGAPDATVDARVDAAVDASVDAPIASDAPDAPDIDAALDAPPIDTAIDVPVGTRGAIRFVRNATREHDYGLETVLPSEFGVGELTFEIWMRLDASFPVGTCEGGDEQLTNWCTDDNEPYTETSWWYKGNFLLDGHNNSDFGQGTFSLQFYGGGRLRWHFGDGGGAPGHWSVGVYPASGTDSLLDDEWHAVALVRRFVGDTGATLELWIDGERVATEASDVRPNMRDWWDDWSDFPGDQPGWFWGAEKQAAVLSPLDQYEDYKGEIAELRYWSIARNEADLGSPAAVSGDEAGLVGWFPFDEGSGDQACDALDRTRCMNFFRTGPDLWATGPAL